MVRRGTVAKAQQADIVSALKRKVQGVASGGGRPAFGGENTASDARAAALLAALCPERKVVQIPARAILTGGGNIHCITQQIPKGGCL